METVFNEIKHSVKKLVDLSPVRNRVYYCRPLAYVLTSQQLCGT